MATLNTSGLAQYILDNRYNRYAKNRSPLEEKWKKNLNAFKCISSDFWKAEEAEDWRSNTFVPITKMKVLAAYSIIIDLVLMNNKIPFDLTISPWANVVMEKLPEDQQDQIKGNIRDMIGLMDQQFADCNADRHLMRLVMSGAIYGEMYAKMYVHKVVRSGYEAVSYAPQGMSPEQAGQYTRYERYDQEKFAPGFEFWSIWDVFRDLETEDLQDGSGIIFRQYWEPYHLRKKATSEDEEYYIPENATEAIRQYNKVTKTTTSDTAQDSPVRDEVKEKYRGLRILEFWGRIPRSVAEQFEAEQQGDEKYVSQSTEVEEDGDEVEIMCMLADDFVVRYARNEEKSRPVYRGIWEESLDTIGGTGVADNTEVINMVLNGMVRAFEDNKKLSANVMGIGNAEKTPDWDHKFKPGLFIDVDDTVTDVGKAWQQIVVADIGETLLSGIALYERWADDASMIPKILQGAVLDKRKPDTFSEMSMLQANAGKYIGGVIRNLDEGIIEPVVCDFYRYNMEDPDVTKGKGDFQAKALGYSSYQDGIVRVSKIMQALNMIAASPEMMSECRLGKMLTAAFRAIDHDFMDFVKTREEKLQDMQDRMNSPEHKAQQEMMVHTIQAAMLKNRETDARTRKIEADIQNEQDRTTLDGVQLGSDIASKTQAQLNQEGE